MPKSTRLLAAACLAVSSAAFAQAPGDFEMELWRSATRLDTPSAYEAYLKAFPQGAFAPMARAALSKGGGAAAPAAPARAAAEPPAPSALQPLQGSANSGATELAVGTRLAGPGVVTVGAIGARRQLVIPTGEWILLAAEDHRTSGTVQTSLATLAFGQFSGAQLRSLLLATFNRRAVTVTGGSTASLQAMGLVPRWTGAERCESAAAGDVMLETGASRSQRRCAAVRPAGEWRQSLPESPPVLEPLEESLKTLRAEALPFLLRSELHLTNNRNGWIGYTRLDAAGVGSAAERAAWLRRFTAVAQRGDERDLDATDLAPGKPALPSKDVELPL